MSNLIQGVVKYPANPKYAKDNGYGPRMNAVITTPTGDVRAYATVGTPEGAQLAALTKGAAFQGFVDDKGNFTGLANAPAVAPQPPVANGHGHAQPSTPAPQAPAFSAQMAEDHAEFIVMLHNAIEGKLNTLDPETVRTYVTTIYISLRG